MVGFDWAEGILDYRIATWDEVLKSVMHTHTYKLLQPNINTHRHTTAAWLL